MDRLYWAGYIYIFNGINFTLEWESDAIAAVASVVTNDVNDDGAKKLIAGIER